LPILPFLSTEHSSSIRTADDDEWLLAIGRTVSVGAGDCD
jgi:hypothetical protein